MKESEERIERVKELCGPRNGADVVIEVAGFPQVVVEGLEMVRPGGTYVEVGNISKGSMVNLDFNRVLHGIKYIVPTSFYEPWLLPVGLEMLERTKDRYPMTKLVSHSFALEDINEAFERSEWLREEGTPVIRSVVKP
jgi:threonine dehydrogenase-like Zn-dependent dehydrogenase